MCVPELPTLPEFEVIERGQSTSMQIINGRVSQAVSFNYILVPRRRRGASPSDRSVRRSVGDESYQQSALQRSACSRPRLSPPSRATISSWRGFPNERPFVGEQVLYTWRFYWRTRPADARLGTLSFGDLLVEDLGEVREYQTTVNGVQYAVSEIRKVLFAQRPGHLRHPVLGPEHQRSGAERPRRRRSLLDDFFGSVQTRNLVLRTDPIELEVRELPAGPGRSSPAWWASFDVRSAITQTRAGKVGESATLEVTVSGSGNAQLIAEPPAARARVNFKVYDDTPVASVDRSGHRAARQQVLSQGAGAPGAPEHLVIGPVELVYFDPEGEQFRTATLRGRSTCRWPLPRAPRS